MPSFFIVVIANDLDPNRVTKAFGIQPSAYWRKGEKKHFISKGGKILWLNSTHKWGGWKLHFPRAKSERELIQKMKSIATKLNKRKEQLQTLVKDGHKIFFISLLQNPSSVIIPPTLHSLFGEIGIHLQLDFWPSSQKSKKS